MTAETSRKWPEVLAAAAIAAAVIAVFGRSLHYPFVDWDDHIFVLHDNIRYWFDTDWYTRLTTPHAGYPVPLPTAVYGLLHHFAGEEQVWAFNLVNIAGHTLNAVLVYVLFRRLKLAIFTAVAASLLWAIHPVMAEPVAWATGLKDILSMTGVLLALLGMTVLERRGNSPLAWALLVLGPLIAIGGKPTGVVIGPMLIVYSLLRFDWPSLKMKLGTAAGAVWTAVGLAAAAYSFVAHDEIGGQGTGEFSFGLICWALETLLRNYVAPVNLSPIYSSVSDAPMAVTYAIGAGVIAVVVILVVRLWQQRPLIVLGLVWTAIALAPVSNIIPLARFATDSYLYTPSLGIALVLAVWLGSRDSAGGEKAKASIKLRTVAVAGLAVLGLLATSQTAIWGDEVRMWERAYERAPQQPMSHIRLANTYAAEGRYPEAIEIYEEYATRFPGLPMRPAYWPISYHMVGATGEAMGVLERYLERGLRSPSPLEVQEWNRILATYAWICEQTGCRITDTVDAQTRQRIEMAVGLYEGGHGMNEVIHYLGQSPDHP